MIAFKLALIDVYQSLKPSVESKLLGMGLRIWTRKGRRIYLNEQVWDYFNLDYLKFINRSCQRKVFGYTHPTKVYFDCDSKEFVGINLENISEYQLTVK